MTKTRVSDEYVFAYGSLLRDLGGALGRRRTPCRLRDHRRAWNVAMDNTLTLAGYKLYLSAADSSRPAVFVTFLNLIPADGRHVSGVLFGVDHEDLAALDERERNYDRRDVTDLIDGQRAGRVWAYIGKPEAERRFALGAGEGRAVIDKAYVESVRAGFASIAAGALEEFDATTEPHDCAVLDLRRVDLD
jgi:cation transport regulator ChaC